MEREIKPTGNRILASTLKSYRLSNASSTGKGIFLDDLNRFACARDFASLVHGAINDLAVSASFVA